MPNRVIRDWTASEKINGLTIHAERFFTRLIMKVDDYGCFYADTRLLKANLYPLLLDNIREADLARWMTECQTADLIVIYECEKRKYLQINDFRQRLDKARKKYPLPSDAEIREVDTDFPAEKKRKEKETETEEERPDKPADVQLVFPFDSMEFKRLWEHWKTYKSKDHRFNYKSVQSEQAALNDLSKIADGKEITALEIIKQSMAKGWKGFFELKNQTNATNGNKPTINSLQEAHSRRYGNGG